MVVIVAPSHTKQDPDPHAVVAFDQLVDASINRPARYMGYELGVEPRDWETARVRWALGAVRACCVERTTTSDSGEDQ